MNEKSCGAYPKEWAECVVFMLDDLCRASECKKDQATNPSPPHNKHTVHWIEMKMEDMRDIIEKGGKLKFGIGFSLSTWKLRDLKKYYHKYPGRNVCLCRYHMDWDHRFDALRRWKAQVKKELNLSEDCPDCASIPSSQALREFFCCPRKADCNACTESERCCNVQSCNQYYQPACVSRSCPACVKNIEKLVCQRCCDAMPTISHQHWTDGIYKCKDGREKKTWDFQTTDSPIQDFLSSLDEYTREFLPHHNRAKFLDHDWKKLFDNVSENGSRADRIAVVMGYANSYSHEHRDEHYQEFWNQLSTTILGCAIKIPVANLTDQYLSKCGYTRGQLVQILKDNGKPPEVTIMLSGMTANQHHDTAGVQHFLQHHMFPWLWENTQGLKDTGALFHLRTDGCRSQFKSARHFRFLSHFQKLDWTGLMKPVHSHFESCHGKDISDPECGRYKYLLAMAELRGKIFKTAKDAYNFLKQHYHTTKSFEEKHARGIFFREFFYTDAKDIRPLACLAEVDTVKNARGQ